MVIASRAGMSKASGCTSAIVAAALLVTPALAQTPVPARRPSLTMSLQIVVSDQSGTGLEGVGIGVSGAESRQASTDAKGLATVLVSPGTYRLRFESERFITLERDVTIGRGQPTTVMVALDAALPPPSPAAVPLATPAPAPVPAPAPAPMAAAAAAGGPPIHVLIPAFLDKNFIGRDPLKESVLACTAGATTRVLQLRDSLAQHTHSDLDEILYVVAGDGVVRVRDETMTLAPGSLTVIPRGLPHATERRGRNPLIVLSTLAGAACPIEPSAQSSGSSR
jgi:mannose-6-phosphate isomerase-like protein (cupin superfamily)